MNHELKPLSGKQIEDLAKELGSKRMMEVAEEVYKKEQEAMSAAIGNMTLKRVDGKFYQKRPQGWVKVDSLSDIIFEDVRELPVNERIRTCWAVCIVLPDGTRVSRNIDVPLRSDLRRFMYQSQLAVAVAEAYGEETLEVYFKNPQDAVSGFRVINKTEIVDVDDIPEDIKLGGPFISLEI